MFEQDLQNSLYQRESEKTFVDKILARKEVDQIRNLIKKERLEREDLLEILYLISGNEAKLLNYGEWDRYVILKYFVWLREFVKTLELFFDYRDDLQAKAEKEGRELSPRLVRLLNNNQRLMEHNAKFLIDLYLNIARTTLSIGASGFMEILTQKFEYSYPQQKEAIANETTKPSMFGRRR